MLIAANATLVHRPTSKLSQYVHAELERQIQNVSLNDSWYQTLVLAERLFSEEQGPESYSLLVKADRLSPINVQCQI